MILFKNKIYQLFCLITIIFFSNKAFAKPKFPKNPKIDAVNYVFNIELSDKSDEITCEVIIDICFLGSGVKMLRLDLINVSSKLENKGMVVSEVSSNGNMQLLFWYALLINLPRVP